MGSVWLTSHLQPDVTAPPVMLEPHATPTTLRVTFLSLSLSLSLSDMRMPQVMYRAACHLHTTSKCLRSLIERRYVEATCIAKYKSHCCVQAHPPHTMHEECVGAYNTMQRGIHAAVGHGSCAVMTRI